MSPQLIILLLQEISQLAPGLIQDFKKGDVSPEQQQALFDAVNSLSTLFTKPQWTKSTDL
jgi:hypothetical protein